MWHRFPRKVVFYQQIILTLGQLVHESNPELAIRLLLRWLPAYTPPDAAATNTLLHSKIYEEFTFASFLKRASFYGLNFTSHARFYDLTVRWGEREKKEECVHEY